MQLQKYSQKMVHLTRKDMMVIKQDKQGHARSGFPMRAAAFKSLRNVSQRGSYTRSTTRGTPQNLSQLQVISYGQDDTLVRIISSQLPQAFIR